MYIRTTRRANKDGSITECLQLAQNEWDKEKHCSIVKVLLNFGRKENVDKQSLKRLITSIQRVLGTAADNGAADTVPEEIRILSTRTYGGCWLLDQLWKRLGIDNCLKHLLSESEYDIPVERALFAMAANRAVDPTSKLSAEYWVNHEAYIPDLSNVSVHQLYRSMDFLVEHDAAIQEDIFFSVANLLNLEVDLIYFDTTATYFETVPDETEGEEADEEYTIRQYGHTKDSRPDLPQIVIGMAVTKEGIPVRCWVFSGETSDMSVVEQVKKDLNGWRLNRVVCVMDRGFSSEENCIKLQCGGGHYIIGEKMRSGKPEVETALSKRGRYTRIQEDLFAKEALTGDGERRKRFVIALNRKEAVKDRTTRERHLKAITEQLSAIDILKKKEHTKAVCALASHKVYGRYLKTGKDGRLAVDKTKVAAEERLDGKYLIKTSDDTLSIEDIVLGYKQLYDIERGFRTLKSELELRPVYHRKTDRIKAHVLICWLALLMTRIVENETGMTWFMVRRLLKQVNLVTLQVNEGIIRQSTVMTDEQARVFESCGLKPPPRVVDMQAV